MYELSNRTITLRCVLIINGMSGKQSPMPKDSISALNGWTDMKLLIVRGLSAVLCRRMPETFPQILPGMECSTSLDDDSKSMSTKLIPLRILRITRSM